MLVADGVTFYMYGHETTPLMHNEAYGTSSTTKYLHTDNIGSVRMVTMEDWPTPIIRADGEYGTYGQARHELSALDLLPSMTPFGYAGEYTDPTGLIYLRNRYYDTATAQFLSVDPIVDVTGEPYSYAGANPLQNTDPLGLDWQNAADWSAGFGDTITFGGTKWVREKLGAGDAVDYCSDFYKWGGHGGDIAGLAPVGGGVAIAGKGAKAVKAAHTTKKANVARTAARQCSFTGPTVVLMGDGTRKPIEEIKIGDKVMATDPETGEQAAKAVEHVFIHDDTVVDLLVDGEVITTTEDHPFWSVTDQRFERADELSEGEHVLAADGSVLSVSGLRPGTERNEPAYNLSVEGIHTYHVGQSEILVHNTCKLWNVDDLSESGNRLSSKGGHTHAGKKIMKHGGQGNLPRAKGSVAEINRIGQEQLDDILTDPGTVIKSITGGKFAGGRYYITPDGRGAAFDAGGVFQYFGVFK